MVNGTGSSRLCLEYPWRQKREKGLGKGEPGLLKLLFTAYF